MRQPPVVLVTQDQTLVSEVSDVAASAGCRVEVAPAPTAAHLGAPMAGRILVGADVAHARAEPAAAGIVALDHHERVIGGQVWLLPQDRAELVRTLGLLARRPPAVPVAAVMGAAGGVGASTVAAGVATALLPAAGPAGVALLDLAGVPEPAEPTAAADDPQPVVRLQRSGLTRLEATGTDRLEASVRAACGHGAVVVADLPRWHAGWLGHVDSVVVVTLNRVGPLRGAKRLLTTARHHGLTPHLALVTAPGGWWPADVAEALGVTPTVVWPTDRRLAAVEDIDEALPVLARGRLRTVCADLAEALLATPRPGSDV